MTAHAYTAAAPPSAIELGLVTDRAVRIATIPDVGVRRTTAAQAVTDRRTELATMRQLLLEAYGTAKPLARIEAADEVLLELTVLAIA